ncbi:AI-2E family transporter [Fimbriiglobus ruber]|uniref:Transport protein n=1 Tax=Fimbriiglobus ruber TaxID=1908690 RepID=A0A225DYJ2_9BACT|nr:AI-2E family transporter [Fimbriiglobus ruber]OWK46431.1 transport protein [Fimbriiglobus ruber]
MPRVINKPDWQRAVIITSATVLTVTIGSLLYWAQAIVIPLALAVFLSFVLSPIVSALQRRGIPRIPSVVFAVLVAVAVCVSVVGVVGSQLASMTRTLPKHEENINRKLATARKWALGMEGSNRIGAMIDRLGKTLSPTPPVTESQSQNEEASAAPAPSTVVLEAQRPSWASKLDGYVSPVAGFLGEAAFSFILVIFILINKEDLRNRMIRLMGDGKVTTTTRAMDDASRRVSRYLLVQFLLNSSFGIIIALVLFAIGVNYALLWGFVAAIMRYVPYIGSWIAVIPPTIFTLAVSDGFWEPIVVVVLFLGLEAICGNVFEPWLYGSSLGVSGVAQLVSAAFWSFLWGPIGLILSGPITACLLILGKYTPSLHFIEIILGDEPALSPSVALFQRLAARDQDEAARIVLAESKKMSPVDVCDQVIIPALAMTKAASQEGDFSREELDELLKTSREVVEEVLHELPLPASANVASENPVRVLLCPAQDDIDQVSLEAFARLLDPTKWEVRVTEVVALASEVLKLVAEVKPAIVFVGSLPPGGMAHTRYLCKRLKTHFPDLKIVVGRWSSLETAEDSEKELLEAGVDRVDTTMESARNHLDNWHPVMTAQRSADGEPEQSAGGSPTRNRSPATASAS